MSEIIDVAVTAASEAGMFLLNNFGKIKKITKKGDRNFATNLDQEAEQMIIAKIKEKFPSHGIMAEESGNKNINKDYLWIIDPLDGTHNYMRDIAIFGVSIGIVHKSKFVGGVIYMPVENELYVAEKGVGAYKNNQKIKVSSVNTLKECSISFDSSVRYLPEIMLKTLGALADKVFNVRMLGSSVRVLTYVAEGKLDASVEFYDRPWDFAGGVCLIEEAGGMLCDLNGKPVTAQTVGYIASNKVIHKKIKNIVFPFSKSK